MSSAGELTPVPASPTAFSPPAAADGPLLSLADVLGVTVRGTAVLANPGRAVGVERGVVRELEEAEDIWGRARCSQSGCLERLRRLV